MASLATPLAAAPSPVRLRLVFDNRHILRRAQRDDGLRRCWLLLRPELATVADLAAHMDGFALPPFESTCIFRDNDIIRVKQKSCKRMVGHNHENCIKYPEVVEKRPLPIDGAVLAIGYQKDGCEEHGDHQAEENATVSRNVKNDNTSSKRKWCDGDTGIPECSKKRKLKVPNHGKHIGCNKEDDADQDQDHSGSRKLMSSSTDIEAKKSTLQAETTAVLEENQKTERNNQTELNCGKKVADCNAQSDTKKLESRSARRKKLKRQIRQKAKAQSEKTVQEESPTAADCPSSSNQEGLPCPSNNQEGLPRPSSNQNGSHMPVSSHKADDESDASEDIVPIVVQPGHIRFEPAGGESEKSPAKEIKGTFQWNGIMSKKKGQKWGMNNSNKKNADINYHARITGSSTEVNHHMVDSKMSENGFCAVNNQKVGEGSINESETVKTLAEDGKSSGEPLDFESLYPLTRLPKEGDLIAYRLVELSSSWCPEISSYRTGKVLIYDPISLRIILLPVPEYPIISVENKPEDESDMPVDMSPYNEDGSLEIEYSSLLDVRLLKGDESVPVAVRSTPSTETGKKGGSLVGNAVTLEKNKDNIHSQKPPLVPTNNKDREAKPETTKNKVWEENGEPTKDKPNVQENGWGTWTPNASTSAWSLRALRSSSIGPTVAILRGKNNQRGKLYNRKYGK